MLRGRQGRLGLRGMSLATFCDIVWQEIYDDCSPMGDRADYRRIVTELFIEGKDPYEIWYDTTDKRGKTVRKRLADNPASKGKLQATGLDALRELRQKATELAQARQQETE